MHPAPPVTDIILERLAIIGRLRGGLPSNPTKRQDNDASGFVRRIAFRPSPVTNVRPNVRYSGFSIA
jgi:hypothetical protein